MAAPSKQRRSRAVPDEGKTRRQLLDVAGRLFAEKGFDRVTSKEICRKARANVAAVNYHFGGIDGLYATVLETAHNQLLSLAAVSAAVEGKADAKAKLTAVLGLMVQAVLQPGSSWGLRVIGREMASPSKALEALREKEILPKSRIMRQIVGEIMNLPPDHPAVSRGCVSVMGPCAMMLIADRTTLQMAFPNLLRPELPEELVTHLLRFSLAGLEAVGKMHQK